MIEQHGLPALTMRRVAAELNCGTMTAYSHVKGRAGLLDAVVEKLIAELDTASLPTDSWQGAIRSALASYRGLAERFPRSFELLALAPYDRPPVAPHLTALVAALTQSGLTKDQSRQLLSITDAYATGFLLVSMRSDDASERPPRERGWPELRGLRDPGRFDQGLEVLISGFATTL